MKIVPLSDVPHHASHITDWLWQAFGAGTAREFYDSIVRSSLNGAEFPVTFVALNENDTPLGTVGFWRCDLISRQDLWPWVAALYVDPPARGNGLSEALQQHVIDYARARGHEKLWLWSTFGGYYERFGWEYACKAIEFPDIDVNVYSRSLR
ncbi:GNAT family N-acetyltransferase [Pantoea sp. Mb-10]|uniref:GNAT family N-acetyltransferase n=1 Tax=unclassified Pantoea TaxID=2630326 RepID=UPI001E2A4CFC|nr:GNAT family N-acetyltransferase [Pantoea sp. Mb-10]MCE0501165.1 GNAT family N-acetyltransferase [Pantoea sp. Pb-8]